MRIYKKFTLCATNIRRRDIISTESPTLNSTKDHIFRIGYRRYHIIYVFNSCKCSIILFVNYYYVYCDLFWYSINNIYCGQIENAR